MHPRALRARRFTLQADAGLGWLAELEGGGGTNPEGPICVVSSASTHWELPVCSMRAEVGQEGWRVRDNEGLTPTQDRTNLTTSS